MMKGNLITVFSATAACRVGIAWTQVPSLLVVALLVVVVVVVCIEIFWKDTWAVL